MAIGSAVFFVYALLNLAGLSATILGINPLGPIIQSAMETSSPRPPVVVGDTSHYRVKSPRITGICAPRKRRKRPMSCLIAGSRSRSAMRTSNHCRKTPGLQLSADVLTHEMVKNAKNAASELTEVSRSPCVAIPNTVRIIHCFVRTVDGQAGIPQRSGLCLRAQLSAHRLCIRTVVSESQKQSCAASSSPLLPTDERRAPGDALPAVRFTRSSDRRSRMS